MGQGPWTNSPVAKPPSGNWKDITPEMMRNTGFYAKQVLLGNNYNQNTLLFWLWVTGDEEGILETLRAWRDQKKLVWKDDRGVPTDEPGNFAIQPEDVIFPEKYPQFREYLKGLVKRVLEEEKK